MSHSVEVSIVGASGYSGAELLKILLRHQHARVGKVFANTSAGKRVDEVYPWFLQRTDLSYETYNAEAACTSDVVFIALPSGEAMNVVPELLKRGKRIIDLGGDFRLKDPAQYQQYYKRPHASAEHLSSAVYGLTELNRTSVRSANLVANPGCYPTGAILPLVPLLKEGLIERNGISISALSGVSGAGRSNSVDLSFVEANESVKAYKVGTHQHIPEIKDALNQFSSARVSFTFVPHLIPITRGIFTSMYAATTPVATDDSILAAFQKYYAQEPFIRMCASIPEVKNVVNTNFIDISYRFMPENRQVVLFSVIDNLIKGAAGQAIQNMNVMFGFSETEGLIS